MYFYLRFYYPKSEQIKKICKFCILSNFIAKNVVPKNKDINKISYFAWNPSPFSLQS